MKVFELKPLTVNKTEFQFNQLKFIPKKFGCYILTNFSDDILYIGLTNNLKHRFKQHIDNSKKTNKTNLGVAFYFYFLIVENENELTKLERGWLNHFELVEGKLPILNSIHSPIR